MRRISIQWHKVRLHHRRTDRQTRCSIRARRHIIPAQYRNGAALTRQEQLVVDVTRSTSQCSAPARLARSSRRRSKKHRPPSQSAPPTSPTPESSRASRSSLCGAQTGKTRQPWPARATRSRPRHPPRPPARPPRSPRTTRPSPRRGGTPPACSTSTRLRRPATRGRAAAPSSSSRPTSSTGR